MALRYKQEQERQGKMSRAAGAVLTVVLHAGLLACCFVTGFSYLDPPPPEKTPILIEFEEPEASPALERLETAGGKAGPDKRHQSGSEVRSTDGRHKKQ